MSKLLVLLVAVAGLAAGLPVGDDESYHADPRQNDVLVHKQFYTHTGPETPSERKVIFGKAKINFKVVFVKIPSSYARLVQSGVKPLSVSLAPVEDRLALYLLTEKTDKPDQEVVNVDAISPTTPPPPEVHFIKYKTPQEATEVQRQITDLYEDFDSQ